MKKVSKDKLKDDVEKAELKLCLEMVPKDDEAVNVESLVTKYPIIRYVRSIQKAQQDYTLISWRLFDSCGIHLLLMDTGIAIYMLVEKKYPLTQEMLSRMLSRRLEVDHECEMAYELIRFIWGGLLGLKDILVLLVMEVTTAGEDCRKYSKSLLLLVVKLLLLVLVTTARRVFAVRVKNMTLIEAARTMLADSKLLTTFWAEAINTACYVQNRVLVVKLHNKTPYELFHGKTPNLSFMRPFGCPITILNTIDHLGKFDGKADEGFFVRYSLNSKAFRVFNSRTRTVEENLHIRFSENIPNVVGSGPDWLFDIDALTRIMNYEPIVADLKSSHNDGSKPSSDDGKKVDEDPRKESECNDQEKEDHVNNTNNVNATSINEVNAVDGKTSIKLPFDPDMHALEDYSIFDSLRDDEDDDAVADMNNLDTTIQLSPNPTKRIHKDHPLDQVIGDLHSATKTRKMSNNLEEHGKNPKSAFLYGKIKEEVYVCQPLGFEDPNFPDRVYKVEKALYGLHQAPRSWYETLSTYLLDNGFQKGKIDKSLFIKRYKGNILLVQVYVDDIIFGSTKKELCNAFEKLMHEKFQMSSMGEHTFFLGLQVKQKKDGIIISQDKYVVEISKKFGFTEVKTASTPMETQKPLLKDENGEEVDVHMY
ncbi:putative ribonuclease H-like domain-containing protein, partial [Tanacetum coccineum]